MARFQLWAPPARVWGPSQEIWRSGYYSGPEPDRHSVVVNVDFDTLSNAPSTFDIEMTLIGHEQITKPGPGSQRFVVIGVQATRLMVRARSHGLGQNLIIKVGH